MRCEDTSIGIEPCVGECDDTVRSVSLDASGDILAVGGDDCFVRCYDCRVPDLLAIFERPM